MAISDEQRKELDRHIRLANSTPAYYQALQSQMKHWPPEERAYFDAERQKWKVDNPSNIAELSERTKVLEEAISTLEQNVSRQTKALEQLDATLKERTTAESRALAQTTTARVEADRKPKRQAIIAAIIAILSGTVLFWLTVLAFRPNALQTAVEVQISLGETIGAAAIGLAALIAAFRFTPRGPRGPARDAAGER